MFKIILLLCAVTSAVYAKSVTVGQTFDQSGVVRKIFEKDVEATAIPFIKRDQDVYFEFPTPENKIKGIVIRDLDNGLSEPSINRGGLGLNFVNVHLKSERGSGLNYQIEIYA